MGFVFQNNTTCSSRLKAGPAEQGGFAELQAGTSTGSPTVKMKLELEPLVLTWRHTSHVSHLFASFLSSASKKAEHTQECELSEISCEKLRNMLRACFSS